ncbi:FG-GAP repeat domain-containing protein [Herpetosiphon llansteffanensis]|uniref:FG-GAP repeat domain-containing protein n=1 Tax=Herpetosiphon llansteffanensis TaxID=2094568 RepID=UPI000D7C81D2|nr:VCBS repeat-containing protein [Herpetosiphon llansteffanensis]
MYKLISLIILSLLAVSVAGANQPARGPLHPKSAAGVMPAAYLASPNQRPNRPSSNSGILQPVASLGVGDAASAAVIGQPLASASAGKHLLRLDWNNGLTIVQTTTLASQPSSLAIGQLNNDRLMDLAALQPATKQLGLWRGTLSQTLQLTQHYTISTEPEALHAADLSSDCRDDLAFVIPSAVQIWSQPNNNPMQASLSLPFANRSMSDLALGDLNYDGQLDVAALRGTGGITQHLDLFALYRGTLLDTEYRQVDDQGFAAHAVAIGDVTNDGRADLVVSAGGNIPNAAINIFAQQSDGSITTTPQLLPAWHLPEALAIADINHDGFNDILALNSGWLALTIYRGRADGTLAAYETYDLPYSTSYRPETLAVGDLNRDGGLDVLIADDLRGLTYLINSTGAPSATIDDQIVPCSTIDTPHFSLSGTLTNATTLEVSLDAGASWQAASVTGTTWSYETELPNWVYPVVMVRARQAERVQAPATMRRLRFQHHRVAAPLVLK